MKHTIRATCQLICWLSRPVYNRWLLRSPVGAWTSACYATQRGWSFQTTSDFLWEC